MFLLHFLYCLQNTIQVDAMFRLVTSYICIVTMDTLPWNSWPYIEGSIVSVWYLALRQIFYFTSIQNEQLELSFYNDHASLLFNI